MNICICDDSAADRAALRRHLEAYTAKYHLDYALIEYESAEAMFAHITGPANFPDLLFLDIFMNHVTGMEAARTLIDMGFEGSLIFTTSSADFAVESYKVNASGYLLKPYTQGDLEHAMDRCRSLWEAHLKYLTVTSERLSVNIFLKNIYYIETGKDHCCLIHTTTGIVRTATPMGELENQLSSAGSFLRCYRSYIVNLDMIERMEDNQLIMKNGDPVMITMRNKARIKKEIADYFWSQTRG